MTCSYICLQRSVATHQHGKEALPMGDCHIDRQEKWASQQNYQNLLDWQVAFAKDRGKGDYAQIFRSWQVR
eukprot:scaffold428975_cov31-Prasinocladus_malaysianus.AAC.1